MNNSITVSSWSELNDLIDTLAIADVVSIDQMTILYTSDHNNQYCLNLDVEDYSITEYSNRRRNKDHEYLRRKTSEDDGEGNEDNSQD
mgnify:CR=1 FL=1|jgi:hypothetical protein